MANKTDNGSSRAMLKSWLGSERMKHGTLAKVFIVVFIAVVVLFNVIVGAVSERFPSWTRFDLTTASLNSLSEESMEVVRSITTPTTIYMIGNEDDIRNDQIYYQYNVKYSQFLNLVQRYAEANSNISYQIINPDVDPNFISRYSSEGVELTVGDILVESERRYKELGPTDLFSISASYAYDSSGYPTVDHYIYSSTADSAIANALYLTNLESVPLVAVAVGHDEMLASQNSTTGASPIDGFYDLLRSHNYDVVEFNIRTDPIPEGTSLVMLPTPTTDYAEEELAKLDEYLSYRGTENRTVFVTFYPTQGELPHLTAFLEEWGIAPGSPGTMVRETNSARQYGAPSYIFADYVPNDVILMDSDSYNYLLTPDSVPMRLLDDSHSMTSRYVLVQASETSYAAAAEQEDPETGTTPIIVISQDQWTQDLDLYSANVVACGNSAMFLDSYVNTSTFGNGAYLIDLFNYTTGSDDISSGLRKTSIETYALDVTASNATLNFFGIGVFTVGIPAVVLIIGLVVFLRRRHL